MTSETEKSVLHTLAFFAVQEKAPTLLELYHSLLRVTPEQKPITLFELEHVLSSQLSGVVKSEQGLFSFIQTNYPVEGHFQRYLNSARLIKKTYRWASFLRYIPFVRAAALSGSVAQVNAGESADIDLFIVVRSKRIFLARFLISAYFQFFGGRRHGHKTVGRFCLNHYIIQGWQMPADHNFYTAQLYANSLPICGASYLKDFWKRNLSWIKDYLISPRFSFSHFFDNAEKKLNIFQRILEFLFYPFAGILEKLLGFLQKHKIHPGPYVLVSDFELSFHPGSRGQRILAAYGQLASVVEKK